MCEGKMDKVPYITVGWDELERAPCLKKTYLCWRCGKRHKVYRQGIFDVIKCDREMYLCGIQGKEWSPWRENHE